jgi:thioredoxin-dependent peroxiredoxin
VCTTELGALAALKPEFEKRNTRVVGLSVDPIAEHHRWKGDVADVTGHSLNFPLIADPNRAIATLYDVLHPNASDTATPADWKQGDDVIIVRALSDEDARKTFPAGFTAKKPYLRVVPQP